MNSKISRNAKESTTPRSSGSPCLKSELSKQLNNISNVLDSPFIISPVPYYTLSLLRWAGNAYPSLYGILWTPIADAALAMYHPEDFLFGLNDFHRTCDLLTLTTLDVLAGQAGVIFDLSDLWEQLLNVEEIVCFILSCGDGSQISTTDLIVPRALITMAKTSLEGQSELKTRSSLLAVLEKMITILNTDSFNEGYIGTNLIRQSFSASRHGKSKREAKSQVFSSAEHKPEVSLLKVRDSRQQGLMGREMVQKILEVSIEVSVKGPPASFRVDLCRKTKVDHPSQQDEPVPRTTWIRKFFQEAAQSIVNNAHQRTEESSHNAAKPERKQATGKGVSGCAPSNVEKAASIGLTACSKFRNSKVTGHRYHRNERGLIYMDQASNESNEESDCEASDADKSENNDSELALDYTACGLRRCGFCGHCPH